MVDVGYSPGVAGLIQPLAPWLEDFSVSEIMVNRPQQVFVEAQGVMYVHHVASLTERHLSRLVALIANESQQVLSEQMPLLSANLYDDSRVQVVLPPVARHLTLCIRRQVAQNLSLDDYAASAFYHQAQPFDVTTNHHQLLSAPENELTSLFQAKRWDEFIRTAILLKKNIVISGGTSSGKTTFLNACLNEIPRDERMITLEDTREIRVSHPNQVQLLASKGVQGNAKVTLQDLVQCALRLRPDRIIIGEIRGREILEFVSAASTGHEGSLTTIHANNPRIALILKTAVDTDPSPIKFHQCFCKTNVNFTKITWELANKLAVATQCCPNIFSML